MHHAALQGVNQGKINKKKRKGKRSKPRAQGRDTGVVAADAATVRQRSLQYYLATARSDARVQELMRQVGSSLCFAFLVSEHRWSKCMFPLKNDTVKSSCKVLIGHPHC